MYKIKQKIDSHLDNAKITTDTLYVKRPDQPLTLRVKTDTYGTEIYTVGESDGFKSKTFLHTGFKETVGLTANYRGLSVALSINPRKLLGKNGQTEYFITYYNNKYGADLTYSDMYEFTLDSYLDDNLYTFEMKDTHMRSLSANAYYVFNGKKMSYPAAFNNSWIQKRSAGSFIVGASYLIGKFESVYDYENDYIASNQSIDMQHVAVGGGYAYNFVPNKHWLVHISAEPSIIVWQRYIARIQRDFETDKAIPYKIKYKFPEICILGRIGATYSWKNYFVGIMGVVNRSGAGSQKEFHLTLSHNEYA